MEEEDDIFKNILRDLEESLAPPSFIQEWFYGPYQSLTSEQICLTDPGWLSEAISQEIINGKSYLSFDLQKLVEINPEFSITLEAKKVIIERQAISEARWESEKKERERIENMMVERELIFRAKSKETMDAHYEEIKKLIGWWRKPWIVRLESGNYKGYTPLEVWGKYSEIAMENFSKAIVDHDYSTNEDELHLIGLYCPGFKLSDEAAQIYNYNKEAYENELAWQEHLDNLAREEHLMELDSFGEPTEESNADWNDNLDLDQQHPDFYDQEMPEY